MQFECIIATPFSVHRENVHMVTIPAVKGLLGVLAHHAPMVVILEAGEIDFYESSSRIVRRFKVEEGYAHITPNFCHVYVKNAEPM